MGTASFIRTTAASPLPIRWQRRGADPVLVFHTPQIVAVRNAAISPYLRTGYLLETPETGRYSMLHVVWEQLPVEAEPGGVRRSIRPGRHSPWCPAR